MYLVVRRGAVEELDRLGELAGAAAVACLRAFAGSTRRSPSGARGRARSCCAPAARRSGRACWRSRTRATRTRSSRIPPRRRSERGDALTKLQAMSTELAPPPPEGRGPVTYALNPRAPMSSGKTLAQIAHAAVLASADEAWVRRGLPGAGDRARTRRRGTRWPAPRRRDRATPG